MTVTEFLSTEVVDFASYSTMRAIASVVDGFKNSGRKVAYSVMNRPNKDTKVSILAGIVAIETEYLHGDISGSIVNMAKKFVGANNMPLLTRDGNFGTRFEPENSATRYIFTAKEQIFDKLFNKLDNDILIPQVFEGTEIEPRFFVPSLPLLLINGSEGIATGFAQKILPRKLEDIKDFIKAYLADNPLPSLPPYYNGFDGIIESGENPNQWKIKGLFEKINITKIKITEVPVGYNLKSYVKVLDDLEDKKVIRSYTDLSEDDKFCFEVSIDSRILKEKDDDYILNMLKLVKLVTENFTVINEDNRIVAYSSPEEVIIHYIKIKMQYLDKRKEYQIQKLKSDISLLESKYLFVKNVTEERILINKKKKDEIISQIEKIEGIIADEGSFDYLLRMQIYNLTEEKLKELKDKIDSLTSELSTITNKPISETWSEEIEAV